MPLTETGAKFRGAIEDQLFEMDAAGTGCTFGYTALEAAGRTGLNASPGHQDFLADLDEAHFADLATTAKGRSMNVAALADSLHRRRQRRAYRVMLKRWNDDGGDARLRFDYALDQRSLVLDLGGYEGQWASDLYARYRCPIVVFEPVERFAGAIAERFRRNLDISVRAFGLGATTRSETIYVHGASSSTHRKQANTETIQIVDVVEWLDRERVERIALMKVNIEGGEYELLDRLIDAGRMGSIDDLQVQFHDFTRDASERMENIQRRLQATHRTTYQYRFIWENWQKKA